MAAVPNLNVLDVLDMSKVSPLPPMHPASAMDFLPPAQLQEVQLTRLTAMVQRSYDHVALFRRRMEERQLKPSDLKSLADLAKLPNKKTLNVAMLGAFSAHLQLPESHWLESLRAGFPEQFFDANRQAFLLGRTRNVSTT